MPDAYHTVPLMTLVVRTITGCVVVVAVAVRTVPGRQIANQFGLTIDDELPSGWDVEVTVMVRWQFYEEPIALDLYHFSRDLLSGHLGLARSLSDLACRGLRRSPAAEANNTATPAMMKCRFVIFPFSFRTCSPMLRTTLQPSPRARGSRL